MNTLSFKIDLQSEFLSYINETSEQFSQEIKFWVAVCMYCFGNSNIITASAFSGYNQAGFENLLQNLNASFSMLNIIYTKTADQNEKKSKFYFGCRKHIVKSITAI